ncbi:SDR family oxidoreductase [Pseudarthrobacter sp. N5]|uniref:SDR family oxidoreductase n=1 Tax=Pseudarthrobacter sp. N5 TaxID=3418416 RepID=UPI003CED53B4
MGFEKLLDGKYLLVSGGTQGVGAAVAGAAAAQGAAGIAITGRNETAGAAVVAGLEALGSKAVFLTVDLTRAELAGRTVTDAVAHFGQIDCAVNAAGLTTRGTMLDTTPELLEEHLNVNLKAPFFVMQETIRHLKERGAPGGIVNIITMSAHGGQPYLAPYVASKAGLIGLTKNAAHAHRWDRIRINGLNIGWAATEGEDSIQRRFHNAGDDWLEKANATVPMGKLGQPDEIADFVVFLLSARSGVVTGSVIDWDQAIPGAHD